MQKDPAMKRVRAIVFDRETNGIVSLALDEVAVPEVGPTDLLIEPHYVGICGSDIEQLHGRMPETFLINYPHTLGHEWVGLVRACGSSVTDFSIGQRVIGHGHLGGNEWFGVTHDGAMAEQFVVPEAMCFAVPGSISDRTAATIEPFACVVQGAKKSGGVSPGDLVHIHGLGTIGLCFVVYAVACGAHVTVFDFSEFRRDLAVELGAAVAVAPGSESAAERRGRATISIEASGHPSAIAAAIESAGHEGRVLLMGVSATREHPVRLALVQQRDLTIKSSTGAPESIWPTALRFLEQARVSLEPIVTTIVPLSDYEHAFALAQDTATQVKVLVEPRTFFAGSEG